MSKVPQHVFDEFHRQAVAATTRNKPTQTEYNHLRIIRIPSMPTALEMLKLYAEVHNLVAEHHSALAPGSCHMASPVEGFPRGYKDGLIPGVPITLPNNDQEPNFFIIEVVKDLTTYQYPFRLDSLYMCGFRVLEPGDDVLEKIWYSFGNVDILPKIFFHNSAPSGLPLAYVKITNIQIHDAVFDKACNHFRYFRPVQDPVQDPVGVLVKEGMFFMLSESFRNRFAMRLTFRGFLPNAKKPIVPNFLMTDLLQDWGDSSKLGQHFWLAFKELEMGLAAVHSHDPTFEDMFNSFKKEVKKFMKYLPLLRFKNSEGNWCLESLVGKSLLILKHDPEKCRMVLMREAGYKKPFLKMLKD